MRLIVEFVILARVWHYVLVPLRCCGWYVMTALKCLELCRDSKLFSCVRQFSSFPSNVYISASNGVRCDILWRKYAQQTVSSSQFLSPSDAVLLFHSFAKIGYIQCLLRFKDHRVIKALSLVILKNVHSLSPCGIIDTDYSGLSLVLNGLKKFDLKNRDLLEIVTNQVCY